jgi:hypothetical protein
MQAIVVVMPNGSPAMSSFTHVGKAKLKTTAIPRALTGPFLISMTAQTMLIETTASNQPSELVSIFIFPVI